MEPNNPPLEPGMSIEEEVKHLWPSISAWVNAIAFGYDRRFKQRLQDLLSELRENNIQCDISDSEIEPPHGQSAAGIRELAEKLLLLAVRMDIEPDYEVLGGD